MRIGRHILILLLTFCLVVGCRLSTHHKAGDVYWVYGRSLPFVAPIEQTNFETNFFGSVDLMIQKGLRGQLQGEKSVTIDPIAIWTVFSYPTKTNLKIETEVHEDVCVMSGWVLDPNGSFRESSNTNKTQSILVRQKCSDTSDASVSLAMLLHIKDADSTSVTAASLLCTWHDGTLENQGLRLMKKVAW